MTRRADRSRSDESDQIARRAARLVHDGLATDLGAALRELGGARRLLGLARRHLQAMIDVSIGPGGPSPDAAALDVALAIMEAIEDLESRTADHGIPYRGVRLMGHAASGRIAPGEVISIRHHGDRDLDDLEEELLDLGAMGLRRSGFQSRWGMLSTLEGELDGVPFRVRRCPLGQVPLDAGHLKSGRPITRADLPAIQRLRSAMGS